MTIMKLMKCIAIVFPICLAQVVSAQKDSVKINPQDTIRIGGKLIIKKEAPDQKKQETTIYTENKRKQKRSNVSTADWVVDIGFANWIDNTNYSAATSQNYIINKPGSAALGANEFKLRTGKSSNVNIWVFMQRLNLIKHYVNLKYGLGVELNNYRFKSPVSFKEVGTNPYSMAQNINHAFVFRDSISFSKNKLAADYVTVPLMLNFNSNPTVSNKGVNFSAGVSMGYLYSTRNKQISGERGKRKNRGDYDLEKWKFSYIAELGLGPARLYGSYTPNSIFENGLNMKTYNVGVRLSNW